MVKKARSGSPPRPNGISYTVYKRYPMLLKKLWQFFRVNWRKGTIPECWKEAKGCFVPKKKNVVTINQFRTTSLLQVEVKIHASVCKGNLRVHG